MTLATESPIAVAAGDQHPDGSAQTGPSLAVRAAGSSIWSMLGQVFQIVLGMGSFAFLSHWLTPHDYGLFGMAATATSFVGVVGDVGVTSAVIRLPRVGPSEEATAFWLALTGALILTVGTGIASPIIAWFYREPSITPLSIGLAVTFVVAAPGRVPTALLSRRLHFRASTIINAVSTSISVIVAVVLASRGYGAWALVTQMLLTYAMQSLLSSLVAPPTIRPRWFSRSLARDMAKFSSQLSGFSFATMVGRSLDAVLAGRLLGSVAVGLMTMGSKLIFFPVERLCGAIYAVFLPATVELSDTDRQRIAFQSTLRLLLIVVAPISLGTVAVAPEIVALLPSKWAGLVPLLRVYALTALILPVNYLSLSVLVAHGRAKVLFRTALVLIPICWTGATLGALSGSVFAMVLAWSFGIVVGASVAFWFAWRQVALKTSIWTDMAAPVGISLVMAFGVRLLVHSVGMDRRPLGFFVGLGVGVVLYAALARVFMSADVVRALDLFRRSIARRSGVSPTS